MVSYIKFSSYGVRAYSCSCSPSRETHFRYGTYEQNDEWVRLRYSIRRNACPVLSNSDIFIENTEMPAGDARLHTFETIYRMVGIAVYPKIDSISSTAVDVGHIQHERIPVVSYTCAYMVRYVISTTSATLLISIYNR